jgi:hypothetical protein
MTLADISPILREKVGYFPIQYIDPLKVWYNYWKIIISASG